MTEVERITCAPGSSRRSQKLQHHQASLGPHHPPHLGQSLLRIGQVAQTESGCGGVEARLIERPRPNESTVFALSYPGAIRSNIARTLPASRASLVRVRLIPPPP